MKSTGIGGLCVILWHIYEISPMNWNNTGEGIDACEIYIHTE